MAEENFTLTTFYSSWKQYQDHIKAALAPLTPEQLELRAWRAGVPTTCARPSPTTGTANTSTCLAPGSSGTSWSMTCITAASSRSPSVCMGSLPISPASACERLKVTVESSTVSQGGGD